MSRKDRWCFSLLIITFIIIIFLFYGIPSLNIFFNSFLSKDNLGQKWHFVGFSNYISSSLDIQFWKSIVSSIIFTLSSVSVQLTFALFIALLTFPSFKGVSIIRWMFILPYFFSTILVVIAWNFFTDPTLGMATKILKSIGIPFIDFRSAGFAFPAMIIVSTYEAFPFCYVVLLARLIQIPPTLYALARLDGANSLKCFVSITWPQIKNTIYGLLVLRIVITALKFDVPWLVYAAKGKSFWSETFAVWLYRSAFEQIRGGKAFAATMIFLLTLASVFFFLNIIYKHYHDKLIHEIK